MSWNFRRKMSLLLTSLVFLFVAAFVLLETGETSCGKGFRWNPLIRKCLLVKCPDGKKLNDKTGKCIKCRIGLEPNLPKCCGTRKLVIHSKISNGETARKGAWPWLAYVTTTMNDGYGDVDNPCGGALISREWVLTAAHCISGNPYSIYKYIRIVVTLGEFDTSKNEKEEIKIRVSKAIPHHGFNSDIENDIALLKLEDQVDINSNDLINTICLPSKTINYQKHTCFVAGWGYLNSERLKTPILQEVQIPIVNLKSCKASYKDSIPVNDDMLCAGAGYKGTCGGDSGGPLVCEVGNQWHIVGIVSQGNDICDVPEYPGIYTRVTSFLDWIGNLTK